MFDRICDIIVKITVALVATAPAWLGIVIMAIYSYYFSV